MQAHGELEICAEQRLLLSLISAVVLTGCSPGRVTSVVTGQGVELSERELTFLLWGPRTALGHLPGDRSLSAIVGATLALLPARLLGAQTRQAQEHLLS